MPRKKTEKPEIYADPLAAFSIDEKAALRKILADPLFVRYLRKVECTKPSALTAGTWGNGIDAMTHVRSTIKLSEIRGWELHSQALFLALDERPARKSETEATYPDVAAGIDTV